MANTRFKTENSLTVSGESNSIFYTNTLFNSTVTVNSATIIVNGALIVGNSASGEPSDLSVTGSLLVAGNLSYTNTSVSGDLKPTSDGLALGNTTYRFDGYFRNVLIYGTNGIRPSSNTTGTTLGDSASRWVINGNTINLSGKADITGNLFVGTTALKVTTSSNQVSINTASFNGALNVVGDTNIAGNVAANAVIYSGRAYRDTNTATISSTSQIVIDKFSNSAFKAVKYFIYVTDSTRVKHAIELSGINAGADILQHQYGEIFNTSLGTYTLAKNADTTSIDLLFTATGANTTNTYTVTVLRDVIY